MVPLFLGKDHQLIVAGVPKILSYFWIPSDFTQGVAHWGGVNPPQGRNAQLLGYHL